MAQFFLIVIATFISEDLTCIATGALIAGHKIGFGRGVLACVAGILFGDLLLYWAGRLVGRPLIGWRPLRKILTDDKVDRASKWLSDRGARVVIASRFTPGLRLPTYIAAGLLKTRFWTFAAYFLLAAVVWTPVLVGGTALLGEGAVRGVLGHRSFAALTVIFGGALALQGIPRRHTTWQARRRLIGWFRRKTRWEFWPPWLAYIPLVPYILYLGLKHRCLTLFTAANPGIPSGGFVGESKSDILSKLPRVPTFTLVPSSLPIEARLEAAKAFDFPVVLKPDAGERGTGVVIARNKREVQSYMAAAANDTIIQEYAGGLEFGIFYCRYPGEPNGRIFSITRKLFPEVIGDGESTILELILRDERAVCLAELYVSRLRRGADEVPAANEAVRLAELGSHCRGAVFLNGAYLETEALRSAVDSVAKSHPGFYFGRFDVRADSIEDLQQGRFVVLELNGVSAEATHVYDPSVGVIEAYRVMFEQWRMAFEIGAANRKSGARPMHLLDFLRLVTRR